MRNVQSIGPYGRWTSNLLPRASRPRAQASSSLVVATRRPRVAAGDSPADAVSHRRGDVLGSEPAVVSRERAPAPAAIANAAPPHTGRSASGADPAAHRVGGS